MAKELIISSNRHETKVAMFEDEQLVEIYFQRADEYSLAGSIHKGRVTRVLPGMQSAFVNIGLERDAFLYVSDFFEESEEEYEKTPVANRGDRPKNRTPQLVDEDTGEPTDESNERFATAQTVASLAVAETDLAETTDEDVDTEGEEEEVEPAVAAASASASVAKPVEEESAFDDRRGRRRRRRRGKGGSGLPESKFADGASRPAGSVRPEGAGRAEGAPRHEGGSRQEGGYRQEGGHRQENRSRQEGRGPQGRGPAPKGPRGPMDEDARWNRKPSTSAAPAFDDEDPPQSVLIAKVSDPNRLPPPRRDDAQPVVLPGESLAKYRRPGDTRKESAEFSDSSEAGGRYSQPRRNRHARAGFFAPIDDEGNADGEKSTPAEGQSASLTPPDDSNPRLAVKAPTDGEGGDAPKPKKRAAAKRATKTAKAPAKRARKKAADAEEPAEETPVVAEVVAEESATVVVESPVESAAEIVVAEETDQVAAEPVTEEDTAPVFAAAVDVVDEPEVSEDPEEVDSPEAEDEAPTASDSEIDEADDADDADETASAADGAGSVDGDGESPRLSRRERRRLRMVERRDERRRERETRRGDETAAPVTATATAVAEEEAPVEGTPAVISAAPERLARHERDRDRGRGDRNDRAPRGEERQDRGRGKYAQPTQSISEVLKEGQEVLVQIAKEPLGQKGARITSHIALPGRYVVYMPTVEHVGVSRKVGTDNERARLRKILQTVREGMQGGFICRTAAEGRTEAEIRADMEFLYNMWLGIKTKADKKKAPSLIHHDLDIVERMLRDQLTDEFKTIWVDSEELYERILRFVQTVQPSLVSRVRLYTKPAPIFDTFNVTSELEKALRPKVWLKSGGYIVINQTEALVAIDVNTGKFVGKSNRLEDTIVKTNLEAVKEAVRQIRLRDLGGIIVVDFIDMDERKNRHRVMQALDEAMMEDRAPYKILQFNDFGLVAITRKRVKQSLERTLCQPCPTCEGAGYIKNVQTIIGEILTEAQKLARAIDDAEVSLRVHPEVGKVLKSHTNRYLEELEEILKVPVIVTSDPLLHPEKFDLV